MCGISMENKKFWREEVISNVLSNDVDEAVREEEGIIEEFPSEARPYFRLGILFYFQGKKQQAVDCFEKCIKLNPEIVGPHIHLGRLHAMNQNYELAWKYAFKAEKLGDSSLREQLERYPNIK